MQLLLAFFGKIQNFIQLPSKLVCGTCLKCLQDKGTTFKTVPCIMSITYDSANDFVCTMSTKVKTGKRERQ